MLAKKLESYLIFVSFESLLSANCIKEISFLLTGHIKYSLLGWSDGGITALILANNNPDCVHRMVVWGSNSFVTKEDMEMIEVSRDVSKWNPKMRDPLEGSTTLVVFSVGFQ